MGSLRDGMSAHKYIKVLAFYLPNAPKPPGMRPYLHSPSPNPTLTHHDRSSPTSPAPSSPPSPPQSAADLSGLSRRRPPRQPHTSPANSRSGT